MTHKCAHGGCVCIHESTSDPTVDDDITGGYTTMSRWINTTNDKVFQCVDNTEGAAVWAELTGSGSYTHAKSILQIWGTDNGLLGGNQNVYAEIGNAPAITSTEAEAQVRMPASKLKAINGYCYNAASTTILTVRKNGVDTGLTVTVDSTGQFRGTGDISFSDGDLLSLHMSSNSGSGTGFSGIQLEIDTELV